MDRGLFRYSSDSRKLLYVVQTRINDIDRATTFFNETTLIVRQDFEASGEEKKAVIHTAQAFQPINV